MPLLYSALLGKSQAEGGDTDPHFADVVLLIDGEQPGSGSDANFANVTLLIDGQ